MRLSTRHYSHLKTPSFLIPGLEVILLLSCHYLEGESVLQNWISSYNSSSSNCFDSSFHSHCRYWQLQIEWSGEKLFKLQVVHLHGDWWLHVCLVQVSQVIDRLCFKVKPRNLNKSENTKVLTKQKTLNALIFFFVLLFFTLSFLILWIC